MALTVNVNFIYLINAESYLSKQNKLFFIVKINNSFEVTEFGENEYIKK